MNLNRVGLIATSTPLYPSTHRKAKSMRLKLPFCFSQLQREFPTLLMGCCSYNFDLGIQILAERYGISNQF